MDGINGILGTTEDKISEPEDIAIKNNQNGRQKESKVHSGGGGGTASVTSGTMPVNVTSVYLESEVHFYKRRKLHYFFINIFK